MLDTETKRRINTCRDILVGKVPDPKSQVEQITIALIYKFMDDMDLEAEEMSFERKFFTSEFERYRWSKLVAPGVGGQEMLNLYTEALAKMVENADLPELFRAIFRNAFLPYRDPETLRSFLREIDGFTYDHSERLGDAFEYLLSVLGSQGDAGQFRTPRHIIDFMVEIIDPKKDEVILDPACGTAGFLISSYKHILKANTTAAEGNGTEVAEVDAAEATLDSPLRYAGDQLTTDDRQRLATNIRGYDISPDMVRLSLVNLYLHGFLDPKVEEYDTLSSEDKWGDTADVILANPPFMSPKGGIRPHNRFQVQSKRSEVLFVDYIAEHLNPKGRAAIVVPEGIIFQSQSAYVALRKMLVDKFLAAVISLPAGVFNPYSGVKTSVLILDRAVAKASDSVAFFKVENDGFGLGAQRRAVKGSQLPQVKGELDAWLAAVRGGGEGALDSSLGFTVKKARIGEGGEYNLSGERYRDQAIRLSVWPLVPLAEVTRRFSGGTPSKENEDFWNGDVPWVSPKDMKSSFITDTEDHISQGAIGASATALVPADTILCVVRSGILKHTFPVAMTARPMCFNQDIIALAADPDRLDARFLFWSLKGRAKEILATGIKPGVTVQSFHAGFFKSFEVPLPPLEVQREIVAEIEGYQKVIDGARVVLENYHPYIAIDPQWPLQPVKKLVTTVTPPAKLQTSEYRETGEVPIIDQSQDFVAGWTDDTDAIIDPGDGLVVFGDHTCVVKHVDRPFVQGADGIKILKPKGELTASFLAYFLRAFPLSQDGYRRHFSLLKDHKIAVPTPEIQEAVVTELDAEQTLVDANRELIKRFQKKIEVAIERVWGADAEAVTA